MLCRQILPVLRLLHVGRIPDLGPVSPSLTKFGGIGLFVESSPSRNPEFRFGHFPGRNRVEELEEQNSEDHFLGIGRCGLVVDNFSDEVLAHAVGGAEDVRELVLPEDRICGPRLGITRQSLFVDPVTLCSKFPVTGEDWGNLKYAHTATSPTLATDNTYSASL